MIYRDFVERMKDASEAIATNLRGARDLTPMVHLETPGGVEGHVVDPAYFEGTDREALVYVVTAIVRARMAEKVAWTFTGESNDGPVLTCLVMDRERAESWLARLYRHDDDPARIGGWVLASEQPAGELVDPIMASLR